MGQNKTPHCTRFPPWGKHKHHVSCCLCVCEGPQIRQRCLRSRGSQRLEEIFYGVDLRFPWFTSHSRENAFSKYHWVLLSAGSPFAASSARWHWHVLVGAAVLLGSSPGTVELGAGAASQGAGVQWSGPPAVMAVPSRLSHPAPP